VNHSDIIVIGAGVSGLVVANEMQRAGSSVVVVEKARGSGGRLSSKRAELDNGSAFTFDLGCASFSAQSDGFKQALEAAGSSVATIEEHGEKRYCGTPRNSMMTRYLADQLEVYFSHRVFGIERYNDGWKVSCETSDGEIKRWLCSRLIISAPPAQSAALLPAKHPAQGLLQQSGIDPQWVAAFALDDNTVPRELLQRLSENPDIEKVSIENDKPGRDYAPGLIVCVIHFSSAWTKQTLNWTKQQVQTHAIECFGCLGFEKLTPRAVHVHRWLYSRPTAQANSLPAKDRLERAPYYLDESGLALCGDYLASQDYEGVERAWLSAKALASAMCRQMEEPNSMKAPNVGAIHSAEANLHGV